MNSAAQRGPGAGVSALPPGALRRHTLALRRLLQWDMVKQKDPAATSTQVLIDIGLVVRALDPGGGSKRAGCTGLATRAQHRLRRPAGSSGAEG